MCNSEKEKYLGGYVTNNANKTLISRKCRAFAVLSEIKALLYEISLGCRKIRIVLAIRETWFINGILFNSEVWGTYSEKHLNELEIM